MLLLCHIGYDLKHLFRPPRNYPCGYGGVYALQPAGVRHYHALYVFKYVAAYLGLYALRLAAQYVAHLCGAVGYGYGLGAARCHQQLFL